MKVKAQEKIEICLVCTEKECEKNCKPMREYLKKEKERLSKEKLAKQTDKNQRKKVVE